MNPNEVTLSLQIPVVGCQHRKFDFKIFQECEEFDLWNMEFDLVPEPTNQFDPEAIKVMLRSTHVGYVAADSTQDVHTFLKALKVLNLELSDVSFYMEKFKQQGEKLQWFTINLLLCAQVSMQQELSLDLLYAE